VIEFLGILKADLVSLLSTPSDGNLNEYIFANDILTNKEITFKSISANDFLGVENDVTYSIRSGETFTSIHPINMAGDKMVLLSIPNIQTKYPVLDNFKNRARGNSDVIVYLTINIAPFDLMKYNNGDGGDSFSYRLENTVVDSLHLSCHHQDADIIDVGEYQLNLQFEIHKKVTEYDVLKKIERIVRNIFQWIGKDG